MFFLILLFFSLSVILTSPANANLAPLPNDLETVFFKQGRPANSSGCRCFPGDTCWPTPLEWTSFNQSLGGKLIATTPIASPCHDDSFGPFDAQKCAKLQATWFFPETHLVTSSSVMAPYFTNNSCNPFLPQKADCTLGNYISYAVNASDATDFLKTIAFVQAYNIRMTVRNTGHDYNGKATGAGAVAIWTHHMKKMRMFDYKSSNYTGKALKMGAGVQAVDAYQYAQNRGHVVVGGNSPSVGIAGGYTQGGGHSPLSSKFGMAADQALEWEVVTAKGEHLIASPSQNSDLYWASNTALKLMFFQARITITCFELWRYRVRTEFCQTVIVMQVVQLVYGRRYCGCCREYSMEREYLIRTCVKYPSLSIPLL